MIYSEIGLLLILVKHSRIAIKVLRTQLLILMIIAILIYWK